MNISQHAFFPRTTIRRNSTYSNSGNLQVSANNDVFLPQLRFGANCSLLCQNFDNDSQQARYKVFLFDPFYRFGAISIAENRVFPLQLSSDSIAFGNNFAQFSDLSRGMVFSVSWYQPSLTFGLTQYLVDDDER